MQTQPYCIWISDQRTAVCIAKEKEVLGTCCCCCSCSPGQPTSSWQCCTDSAMTSAYLQRSRMQDAREQHAAHRSRLQRRDPTDPSAHLHHPPYSIPIVTGGTHGPGGPRTLQTLGPLELSRRISTLDALNPHGHHCPFGS